MRSHLTEENEVSVAIMKYILFLKRDIRMILFETSGCKERATAKLDLQA